MIGATVKARRDRRGRMCSVCLAYCFAVVEIGRGTWFIAFCRGCSRRVGVASERFVDPDHVETEG